MADNYTDTTDTNFKGEPYNIDTGKPLSAEGVRNALHTKENVSNKITTINNQSTDAQYPSAKVIYDTLSGTNNDIVHKANAETITGVKTFGTTTAAAEPLLGMAKTTGATNSGTKFATEAQVYSLAQELTAALLPVGMILAMSVSSWTNAGATFQSKWRVCDGTGGTPNLSGRFLRGGTSTDAATGGADSQSITLTTSNLPAHNHTMQDAGDHTHYPQPFDGRMNFDACGGGSGAPMGIGYGDNMYAGNTTTLTLSSAGSHAHTINNSGGGVAFTVNTVPAYYTVIYVMKVA
ncbi:MAG: hypothetical protein LBK68_07910 [Candidatus Margulisbacteria bacterium]|nr:hypothetical protein [Candidatus Margulisiibacteriota bacterium]